MSEIPAKLERVRRSIAAAGIGAVRLRGTDWFNWACAGASHTVLLAAETGIAQVLITPGKAVVLTNSIEAARLRAEELPAGFDIFAPDWPDEAATDNFVRAAAGYAPVASDRPAAGEAALPDGLARVKQSLLPQEIERYRALGRDAAAAMRQALSEAEPGWSELLLAGAGARALLSRGIEPALILAGGESRVGKYRHPIATTAPLGGRAMLVFCGRRHGLYANLTRFVYFRAPSDAERRLMDDAAKVEAAAFEHSRAGASLGDIFGKIAAAYADAGYPGEQLRHHQGGTTGYLSREAVARPGCEVRLEPQTALAWNPSLPGAKMEDTVLLGEDGLEILTADPQWPRMEISGRSRPDIWIR
ncbi:MAG: M24 family metallopeptidase [Elusimicrobiales bacterium]